MKFEHDDENYKLTPRSDDCTNESNIRSHGTKSPGWIQSMIVPLWLEWLAHGLSFVSADERTQIVDGFGTSMVEPWLAAHGDLSRCVLLGVSCGANIANDVAQYSVKTGRLLDPVRAVARVLMYPFFIGSSLTRSEIKLERVPLKYMPPTLTVIAEHDLMCDRAIAYSEALRKVNVDAPLLDYKDTIHEFATPLEVLLKTPQSQACSEDIAIWVKKYISLIGYEFSY